MLYRIVSERERERAGEREREEREGRKGRKGREARERDA
jgi:hypothetical protein